MRKKCFVFTLVLCFILGGCGNSAGVSYDLAASSGELSSSGSDASLSAAEAEEGQMESGSATAKGQTESGSATAKGQTESGSASGSRDQGEGGSASAEAAAGNRIYVHVCGAVQVPGVYELAAGSRVYQALAAAGGLTEDADERYLNQAGLLEDGQQVLVYTREEIAAGVAEGNQNQNQGQNSRGGSENGGSGKVNLNTADKDQLLTLPGIGDTRAEAILAYRDTNGNFASIEEIMNVEGIKEKMYEKLKDYIEV